jgi:uncharacterized protein YidB (DUF937 family)
MEENRMSNRMPSLAALLGLVAVAGYQNRDKIGDFVKGLQNPNAAGTTPGGAASPDRPEQSTDMIGSGYSGGSVLGGLGDLVEQFTRSGQGEAAKSWVSTGANQPIDERQMEQALGPDLIERLTQQTGLDRSELLRRLSQTLPGAVDQMTPEGRIPHMPV